MLAAQTRIAAGEFAFHEILIGELWAETEVALTFGGAG